MLRLLAAISAFLFAVTPALARGETAVNDLLAADRNFAAAAARAPNAAAALGAMFDEQVVMPVSGRGHLVGRSDVVAALAAVPGFDGGVLWAPIRAGVSADGTQGFTYGFLDLAGGDPARRGRKYLAYWIHRPQGWRVVTYRQTPRAAGEVSTAMLAPLLPGFTARPSTDPHRIDAARTGLAAAEQAFSDRAQQVGLHDAFREFGNPEAMNMYSGAGFTLGLEAVVALFDVNEHHSPVNWHTERSFAAASGDLGVSIGTIHANPGASDHSPDFPFFTIWRRDSPNGPWRYVAE